MVIKALLEGSIKGVGKFHKTPVFPCGIFQVMSGVNKELSTPNYDLYRLALESTAKRLYPNYANCDVKMQQDWIKYDRQQKEEYINSLNEKDYNSLITRLEENPELQNILMLEIYGGKIRIKQDLAPVELFSTMGCRTQNGADINAFNSYQMNVQSIIKTGHLYDNYISAAQKDGRGNICPVTIILPTLAMETKEKYPLADKNELFNNFIQYLDQKIEEAKDMLIERFKYICAQDPASAKFMWENNTMSGYIPEEGIISALKHGTLALGQIGLAETLQILIGKDHTTKEGMNFAKQIEELFAKRCKEYKEKYKLNFGVYYSPAENMCYTSMKKFQKKYGIIENISDKDFFTNSIHVPVWKEIDPFTKIDIESQLTGYSSAGCITYVELDSGILHNIDALEQIVNYAMDKDIPYFALNIPNDLCLDCGYTGEINNECPQCKSQKIQRLRRVTGYLTGDYKTAFNLGKQQETEMRFKHSTLLNQRG